MQVGEFVRKPYSITKDSSFSVEQVEINKQIFVNYRSLEVQFGKTVYRPKSTGIGPNKTLSKQIKEFLTVRENVIHLNLISQVLNKWNYFEIWEREDEKQDAGIPACQIKPSIISSCGKDMLLPDEVQKTIHKGVEMNCPIGSSINYYPIWRMEGSKKDSSCRHVIHFDLLVYILSNVFVQFRKEFMSLVTVDLQIAQVRNTSLQQVKSEREVQLEIEVERLRGENKDLVSQMRQMNDQLRAVREQNENQTQEMRNMNDQLALQAQELQDANDQLVEVRNQNVELRGLVTNANDQLVEVRNQNVELRDLVIQTGERTANILTDIQTQINDKLPNSILTTGTAKELLIIIRRPALTEEFRENKLMTVIESVFDTISCQKRDRAQRLRDHNFDPDNDEIVREYESANAIDLNKFLKLNVTEDQAKMYSDRIRIRKLIYLTEFEVKFLNRLDRYANSVTDVRILLNQTIQDAQADFRIETRNGLERIERRLDRIEEAQVAQANEIRQAHEEIQRVRTALEQIVDLIGQRIQLPGRNRVLQVYAGRENRPYVNLDRRRHYLNEEEANYALRHR